MTLQTRRQHGKRNDKKKESLENAQQKNIKKENEEEKSNVSIASKKHSSKTNEKNTNTSENNIKVKNEADNSVITITQNDLPMTFNEEEKVLCFHGPLIYEAKILKGEMWENKQIEKDNGPHYFVHYKGWKQTWDEWVPETRVLKFNEVNLKRQADLKSSMAATRNTKLHDKKVTHDNGTDRGKKRSRENVGKEEEFLKKPEIKIIIPDLLKLQLVDDWENITKDQKLVPLPRKPNVEEILENYRILKVNNPRKNHKDDVVSEMLDGIKQYFDKALGNILLYRFERQQYVTIKKEYPDKEMSTIYGAEHLLRLFVQFPQLLAHTNMDQDSMSLLKDQFTEFLEYMSGNSKKMFLRDYENASPIYISLIKDN